MILAPAPVSYRQLSWDSTRRAFIADASDLKGLGRVYDDACDEGFTVVGKTGREVVFVLDDEKRDDEGEVHYWTFVPARPGDRTLVASAIIFND